MNRGRSFDKFTGRVLVCSFCRKQQDQVQRLIAGPGGVYVCDECVAALSRGPESPQEEQGLRCSFCGKYQQQVPYLAIGPYGVNICRACLVLCQEIIAEEGPHQRQASGRSISQRSDLACLGRSRWSPPR